MHAQDGRPLAGRRRRRAAALAAAGTIIGLGALSAPALADFDTTADAEHVAKAILNDPADYLGAEFTVRPTVIPEDPDPTDDVEPDPAPAPTAALVTTALGGFPLAGPDYAALASGTADEAHTISADKGDQDDTSFDDTPEMAARGTTVHDMTTLRIDFDVPDTATCLALSYRFYSEEFPEFVGSEFNDAFIAELDESTWTTDPGTSEIQAAGDFATKAGGKPVSVNGVGPTAVDPVQSDGTIFDAATGLVTTKTPVTGGEHSIYLSIFDQGDRIYDSTVLVDRLAFLAEPPTTCKPPEVPVITPPPPPPPPAPGPPPPPPTADDFTVPGGSVQFNKGSATVVVQVPGPGTVTAGEAPAAGAARAAAAATATTAAKAKKKLVKPAKAVATQAGPVKLKIKPTKAGKKILKRKHRLKVTLNITFTPTGGTPNTEQVELTIRLKKKHKH